MKITKKVFEEIKVAISGYPHVTLTYLAEHFNISTGTVSNIANSNSYGDYKKRINRKKKATPPLSPLQLIQEQHQSAITKIDQMIEDLKEIKNQLK